MHKFDCMPLWEHEAKSKKKIPPKVTTLKITLSGGDFAIKINTIQNYENPTKPFHQHFNHGHKFPHILVGTCVGGLLQ